MGKNGYREKKSGFANEAAALPYVLLCFLILFSAIMTVTPAHAADSAAEEQPVRVGAFAGAYISENENGERTGYGYEFQQAVAAYTGWRYDYVACDWTDCYDKLEQGEIDILGGISYTPERAETMLFSDLPMGEERYYLYADLADTDISFVDLHTLDGKRIGVLEGSIPEKLLNEWEEKHSLHTQHIGIISAEDILDKLTNREIDCFISNEDPVWSKSGITAVSLVGAINDYIGHAADTLGNQALQFELIGFDTQAEQYEALKAGQIDMIFHVDQNPYQAEINDLVLSNHVFESSMAVMTTSDHFDEHEEHTVAVSRDAILYQWYIAYNYPRWKVIEYESKEDMVAAVRCGEADCFVIKARQSIKQYEDKSIKSVFLTKSAFSCFAVNREDTVLLSILNKTLDSLQTSKMSGAVAAYDNAVMTETLLDLVEENLLPVAMIFAAIFLVILFVIIRSNKKTKKALAQAEAANAAKSNFLFNMSHDIRTPMNALLGYNELMKKELTDPKLLAYQEKIEQSGNLLLSIINNVLDMARIESGKVELDESYVNITDTLERIDGVFEEEAKKKGIRYIHEVRLEHPHIMCDVTKVHEVLVNLISNAIKYTPEGGTVSVKLQEIPCSRAGYMRSRIEVADNGIGMSEEFLPSLFVAFARERNTTTGKVAGTGLGMPIVKKYIDMMGGTIKVESELGKGSRFTVFLEHRIADREYYEPQEQLSDTQNSGKLQGKRILLAEDNELNAEIAVTLLEDMGLIVERVADGVECVDQIQRMPAGSYDLILMDIQMPNMDGYKATQTIRHLADEKKAGIPIIAMTANAFEEDRQQAMDAGMNGHIAKPLEVDRMVRELERWF